MCFNLQQKAIAAYKRAIYNGHKNEAAYWKGVAEQAKEWFSASAFAHPKLIVYTDKKPLHPQASIWGLVPNWAKTPDSIWNNTLNARGETIFEKASFKKSAIENRCLIPVDGFYEYHDFKGKKYPHFITRKDGEVLYFAGLWNDWKNPSTGDLLHTCSIVTTHANPLMAKIHNKPKLSGDHRMPVILSKELMEEWLKPLSEKELKELATYQLPDSEMVAWAVQPLTGKNSPGNVSGASEKFEYEELAEEQDDQLTLFG